MKILARVSRKVAAELGEEYAIRPFHSSALMRLDRREALELLEDAVRLYPTDAEARGEYIRRAAIRGL
jgi:hypothetical protein